MKGTLLTLIVLLTFATYSEGRARYCYTCRSRGGRGDCKDPFLYNATAAEKVKAIKITPCASQWCGKIIEGKEDDQDFATERLCLQRPPEDQLERCADTLFKRQKVFMCFCKGDLCNSSSAPGISFGFLVAALLASRFL